MEMTAEAAREEAKKIREYLNTPEGIAGMELAVDQAARAIKELELARRVPWRKLIEPFTI